MGGVKIWSGKKLLFKCVETPQTRRGHSGWVSTHLNKSFFPDQILTPMAMVPAWPQVLSQPCPNALLPVLSPWPGQDSIRQVQVGPSGQDGLANVPARNLYKS